MWTMKPFPSHFGTGTEDYYGYAWGRYEPWINHPFVAQPMEMVVMLT